MRKVFAIPINFCYVKFRGVFAFVIARSKTIGGGYMERISREILTREDAAKLTGEYIEIPHGYTEIGFGAFSDREDIVFVTAPDGMLRIGDTAFACCRNLIQINIPDGVTHIGESAFSSCVALKEIILPNSIVRIGDAAFIRTITKSSL